MTTSPELQRDKTTPPHPESTPFPFSPDPTADVSSTPAKRSARPATWQPLSRLLQEAPEGERFLILEGFEEGIIQDGVTAVQVSNQTFQVSYLDRKNKRVETGRPEELVLVDERLTAWMTRKRAEAERALMLVTGVITVDLDTALSNPDRALELAQLRRTFLKNQGQTKGVQKGKAAGAKPEGESKAAVRKDGKKGA